jgi:hypothetical protein
MLADRLAKLVNTVERASAIERGIRSARRGVQRRRSRAEVVDAALGALRLRAMRAGEVIKPVLRPAA